MTSKNTIFVLSALVFAFVMFSFASASTIENFVISAQENISHSANSFTLSFNLTNSGTAGTVNLTMAPSSGTFTTSFSEANPISLAANQSKIIRGVITFPKYQTGTLSGTITADPFGQYAGSPKSASFSVNVLSSSSLSISKIRELTRTQNGTINVTNTGNTPLSLINLSSSNSQVGLYDQDGNQITSPFSLSAGTAKLVTLSTDFSQIKFGTTSFTITAKDILTDASSSTSFTPAKTFCKYGQAGSNLTMSVDISSDGDDDEEWKPLDIVTVEVEVSNDGDERVRDINVELGIYDENGKNVANDLEFLNSEEEEIDLGDIKADDSETATFKFKVPAKFDDGSYKLAVKAYSKKTGEQNECTDYADEAIDVIKQDDSEKYIAFDEIKIVPSEATCGESVVLTANIVNVGDEEQDQTKVNLVIKELGISLSKEIKDNLDSGDDQSISFNFIIPSTASSKIYTIELDSEYDYSNGVYKESSKDSEKVPLTVIGCKASSTASSSIASIAASLLSEAVAGKEMSVKATITSLLNQESSFVISASGYESWADLSDISSRLVTLKAGESKDITIKFNVKSTALGKQTFNIEARSGDKTQTREVEVNLASAGFFTGNTLIWTIGIINVVLIILIVIVAVKLSSR